MANAIVKIQIVNDKDRSRHVFVDNRCTEPQLFAIMLANCNLRGSGIRKANRVGHDSECSQLGKSCDRGAFTRKVDKRLGMVISMRKDSNTL